MPRSELTLRRSRPRHLGYAVLCLLFVVGGVLMVRDGRATGWFVLAVFGLGLGIFIVQMLPGAAFLRLDREGFTVRSMFRSSRVRWSDVAGFGVARIGGNRMVVFDFVPGYGHQRRGRALASALAGVEGALPDCYGLTPEALASLMNDWLAARPEA